MSFALKRQLNIVSRKVSQCVIDNARRNYSASTPVPSTTGKFGILSMVWKGTGVGAVVGIAVGSAYAWYTISKNFREQLPLISVRDISFEVTAKRIERVPNVTIARQVVIPTDKSGLELILFQYPTCPFCCKVRAFLDFYGLSYSVVEVDPVLRQQIKWSEYKKVPILLARSEDGYLQLNDSSMIISCIATLLKMKNKVSLDKVLQYYPTVFDYNNENKTIVNKYFIMDGSLEKQQAAVEKDERKWRLWADDVLVHTLSPNVYRTTTEALQAFNWFSEVGEWERLFPKWERTLIINIGAYAMYFVGKRLQKKHGLKENVRQSLYDECKIWINEVEKRGKFFGGSSPNLADLAVYGVLNSIEGCLTFKDLLDNTKIGTWYSNMKIAVQSHKGVNNRQ